MAWKTFKHVHKKSKKDIDPLTKFKKWYTFFLFEGFPFMNGQYKQYNTNTGTQKIIQNVRSSSILASNDQLAGSWYSATSSSDSITRRVLTLDTDNYFVDKIITKSRNHTASYKTSGVFINGKSIFSID